MRRLRVRKLGMLYICSLGCVSFLARVEVEAAGF